MVVTMRRLLGYVAMLCLIEVSQSRKTSLRNLNTKVDICLKDVLELKVSVQSLRDDVISVQDMQNETSPCSCDPDLYVTGLEEGSGNVEGLNELIVTSESSTDESEAMARVMQKGFQDEKAALRSIAKKQNRAIDAIVQQVTDAKAAFDEKQELFHNDTLQTMAGAKEEFDKHRDTITNDYRLFSENVQDVMQKMPNETEQEIAGLKRQIEVLNENIAFLQMYAIRHPIHETSMYNYHSSGLSWAAAKAKCQAEGFYLAEINDAAEHAFVRKLIGSLSGAHPGAWVGGTDSENEGVWIWATSGLPVDGSLWTRGEPNNDDNDEHCMHNYGTKLDGHNDLDCDMSKSFVCEKDLPTLPKQ